MAFWCTYCGKQFTRKEHLERHLPSHTNIKPYRCPYCQLHFTRKDLLQRHMMSFHESDDRFHSTIGGHSSGISSRALIACQNCATAKTGCDKKIPCSRCAGKKLKCAARYARRSPKAAMRASRIASSSPNGGIKSEGTHNIRPSREYWTEEAECFSDTRMDHLPFYSDDHDLFEQVQNPFFSPSRVDLTFPPQRIANHIGNYKSFSINNPSTMPYEDRKLYSSVGGETYDFASDFHNHIITPDATSISETSIDSDHTTILSSSLATTTDLTTSQSISEAALDLLKESASLELDIIELSAIERPSSVRFWPFMLKLRQSELLDRPSPKTVVHSSQMLDQQWESWKHYENLNRLVYGWVRMDQELSLFDDTGPMLSVSALRRPLPSLDVLWRSKNANEWRSYLERVTHSSQYHLGAYRSLSLKQLFESFLHGQLSSSISPQQLRLLLYPIQSLVHSLQHILSCVDGVVSPAIACPELSTKEVRRLLQQWHILLTRQDRDAQTEEDISSSLVLYHILALNLVIKFPEVERLARNEGVTEVAAWHQCLVNQSCISNWETTIFHCRQAFHYLQIIDPPLRPWWWPTAVYRATLILSVASNMNQENQSVYGGQSTLMQPPDVFPSSANNFTAKRTSTESSLSKLTDIPDWAFSQTGFSDDPTCFENCVPGMISTEKRINDTRSILRYGVELIGQYANTNDVEELKRKLIAVAQTWDGGMNVPI